MTSFHLFDPKKSEISDFFRSRLASPICHPASEATEGHLAEGTFPFALGLASWQQHPRNFHET